MQKPIDMVIEQYGMLVELDGRQHEQEEGAFGEAPGAQFDRDRQLDRLVLASGRRLLRLHYNDAESWGKHAWAAIQRVKQAPNSSFVYYSASYPDTCRVKSANM